MTSNPKRSFACKKASSQRRERWNDNHTSRDNSQCQRSVCWCAAPGVCELLRITLTASLALVLPPLENHFRRKYDNQMSIVAFFAASDTRACVTGETFREKRPDKNGKTDVIESLAGGQ